MPSVTTSIFVLPETLVSSRVRYPTVCPGASPSCFAMYRAADRAASRRGSSIRIFRLSRHGASNSASGTLVVLPAPGGACSRAVVPSLRVCFSSGSMCSIGGMFWVGVSLLVSGGGAGGCFSFLGEKELAALRHLYSTKKLKHPPHPA